MVARPRPSVKVCASAGLESHPPLALGSTTARATLDPTRWYKVRSRREPTAVARQKAVVSAKAELRQEQTSCGRYHMGIADVSRSFIERSIVMHENSR